MKYFLSLSHMVILLYLTGHYFSDFLAAILFFYCLYNSKLPKYIPVPFFHDPLPKAFCSRTWFMNEYNTAIFVSLAQSSFLRFRQLQNLPNVPWRMLEGHVLYNHDYVENAFFARCDWVNLPIGPFYLTFCELLNKGYFIVKNINTKASSPRFTKPFSQGLALTQSIHLGEHLDG